MSADSGRDEARIDANQCVSHAAPPCRRLAGSPVRPAGILHLFVLVCMALNLSLCDLAIASSVAES
ncbi:hypothetical protein LY78DRAFT_660467 [Colletotrichum sublineola]|nr:hypothetical protein LY78DRAFT_660467 [Colletotrichum sublineola]